MSKKLLKISIAFVLVISAVGVPFQASTRGAGTNVEVILSVGKSTFLLNGKTYILDSPPIIKNGRTLVPIRVIVEALGGEVAWESATKKVTIELGTNVIELWIGRSIALVGGTQRQIDPENSNVVPEIVNGRTLIPLRFVAENIGCGVEWNGATRTIKLTFENTVKKYAANELDSLKDASITIDVGKLVLNSRGDGKPEFSALLKSLKCFSNAEGEFTFTLSEAQMSVIPFEFCLMFTVVPPKNFPYKYSSNVIFMSLKKTGDTQFSFKICVAKDGEDILKAGFIVKPESHIVPLRVKAAMSKKALDAFINATTKAKTTGEPIAGADVTVEKGNLSIITEIRKTHITGKTELCEATFEAFLFDVEERKTFTTDPGGKFIFTSSANNSVEEVYLLMSVFPQKGFTGVFDTNTLLLRIEPEQSGEYEFTLLWLRSLAKTNKGTFAVSSKAQT